MSCSCSRWVFNVLHGFPGIGIIAEIGARKEGGREEGRSKGGREGGRKERERERGREEEGRREGGKEKSVEGKKREGARRGITILLDKARSHEVSMPDSTLVFT